MHFSDIKLSRGRSLLLSTVVISGYGFFQFVKPALETGILFISRRWLAMSGAWLLGLVLTLALLGATWSPRWAARAHWGRRLLKALSRLGWANNAIFLLLAGIVAWLLVGPYGQDFKGFPVRLGLFWLSALMGGALILARHERGVIFSFGAALVFITAVYKAAAYLPDISTYPFSMGWSETSRYYYASLYFSKRIYGMAVPPTVLHPTRYLMQAVPFLLDNSPSCLITHRCGCTAYGRLFCGWRPPT